MKQTPKDKLFHNRKKYQKVTQHEGSMRFGDIVVCLPSDRLIGRFADLRETPTVIDRCPGHSPS